MFTLFLVSLVTNTNKWYFRIHITETQRLLIDNILHILCVRFKLWISMLYLNQGYSLNTLERCLCVYLTWFDWIPQHSFVVLRQRQCATLYIPVWTWICSNSPASASEVVGLEAWATTSSSFSEMYYVMSPFSVTCKADLMEYMMTSCFE